MYDMVIEINLASSYMEYNYDLIADILLRGRSLNLLYIK
jgi:hypothetical protein